MSTAHLRTYKARRTVCAAAWVLVASLLGSTHAGLAAPTATQLVVDNDFGGNALYAIFGGSTCLQPRLPTRFNYLTIGPLGRSLPTTVVARCDGFIRVLLEPVRDQSEIDACEFNISRQNCRFVYSRVPPQGQATLCSIRRAGSIRPPALRA